MTLIYILYLIKCVLPKNLMYIICNYNVINVKGDSTPLKLITRK